MKVYLASWFNSKELINTRATELRNAGIEVTARWLDEKIASNVQVKDVPADYLLETAETDIQDILLANVVVLNIPSVGDLSNPDMPTASWARGGRHFESGFHYATMLFFHFLPNRIRDRGPRQLVLVGEKENVFHYLNGIKQVFADGLELPAITQFYTWNAAKEYLITQHASVTIGV